ncbi:MAG: alkyl sulfatase [Trebonia sp.]|nr:alkyl sulfatase [Trebonia sp.]
MSASAIDVRKVAGHIGAEITGIRLGPDLPTDIVTLVRDALLEHKVVFVRGQGHLDAASQQGYARLFGDLTTGHPTVPGPEGAPNVFELDAQAGGGKANSWHTDVTFVDRPPAISVLRAITLPPYGGDTCWANTAGAYESLSPALRAFAEQLWALHSNDYDYGAQSGGGVAEKSATDRKHHDEVFKSTIYQTEHPLVRVHPETGERALLLGHFVRRILGGVRERLPVLVRPVPGARDPAGEHGPLALGARRHRHVGQPRHPALRDRRLRRPAAQDAPGHGLRRPRGQCDG